MNPLVSILIPAFNAEATIADTIDSALGQTWPRKEVIVVDDGSTDQTLAVAQRFVPKGVTVVAQSNQGAAAARNKAFSISRGDYIQWLDADDLLGPEKIAKQMEAWEKYAGKRTLLSCGWAYFIYRPHRAEFVPTPLWYDLSPVDWLVRKLDQNLHMQTATWLVSRELTQAAGTWDTRLLGDDDGEYFCRVLLASDGVRFVPQAKVFYRRSSASLSYLGVSNRKIEAQFISMKLHINYLRSLEDTQRVRIACLKYLQRYLVHFHPERPDIVREAEQIAASLGGQLQPPRISWKYSWIQKLFGFATAKRTQVSYNNWKSLLIRCWDNVLFRIESRAAAVVQATRTPYANVRRQNTRR